MLESYRAWNDITDYVYFGGRLLYTLSAGQALTRIYSDRLGSTRATETIEQYGGGWTTRNYYPFGEEMTAPQGGDQYKFASTYRDSTTGLDYAINRYYASGTARFLTPDPYQASGGPAVPQNWNRYTYVHNDPINYFDPSGTNEADPNASYQGGGGISIGFYTRYGPEGNPYSVVGPVVGPVTGTVPSAPVVGTGGPPAVPAAVSGARNAAVKAIKDKKDCAALFGGSAAADSLAAAKLVGKDLGAPTITGTANDYTWTYTAAFADPGNNTIQYNTNSNGFLDPANVTGYLNGDESQPVTIDTLHSFNYNPDGVNAGAVLGREATVAEYQTFLMLHEYTHFQGKNNSVNLDRDIVTKCLK